MSQQPDEIEVIIYQESTPAQRIKAEEMIRKARYQLITDKRMTFFSVVCMNMKPVPLDILPTAATDGRHLFYNPIFISNLTQAHVKGVVCHEVGHITGFHFLRQNGREAGRWNIAADIKINSGLRDIKIELPEGAQYGDWRHNPMTAEEVYNTLPKDNGKGKGAGDKKYGRWADSGGCGTMVAPSNEKGEKLSAAQAREQEQKMRGVVEEAARMAKAQGHMPQFIERMINESLDDPLPWGEILRRFMTQYIRADWTWRRPAKRMLGQGLYLPSQKREGVGEIVVTIDTSGSIGQAMINNFAKQVQAIVDEAQPDRIHIIYCDAQVHGVDTFEKGDEIIMKARGGGGTDFRPAFSKVEEMGISPLCHVFFTDTYGTFPQQPDYPVIWAVIGQGKVPWGDVVKIDMSELA